MVYQTKIRLINSQQKLTKAIVSAMAFSFSKRPAVVLFLLFLIGCNQSDLTEPLVYEGPQRIFEDVESFYTENNQMKVATANFRRVSTWNSMTKPANWNQPSVPTKPITSKKRTNGVAGERLK